MKRFDIYQEGWNECLLTGFTSETVFLRDQEGYNFNIPLQEFNNKYSKVGSRNKNKGRKRQGKNTQRPVNVYKYGLLVYEAESVQDASRFTEVVDRYVYVLLKNNGETRSGYKFEYAQATKTMYNVKIDGQSIGVFTNKKKIAVCLKIGSTTVDRIVRTQETYKGITIEKVEVIQ